jgi:tetratricopeptide (TPR) repeat protein
LKATISALFWLVQVHFMPCSANVVVDPDREQLTALGHNNRGVEFGAAGDWERAIKEHECALKAQPDNRAFRQNASHVHLLFGDTLVTEHQNSQAMREYREALFFDEFNGPARTNLGRLYQFFKEDPNMFSVHLKAAQSAERECNFHSAVVEYRECVRLDDSSINNYFLGKCLIESDCGQLGHEVLKHALNLSWSKKDRTRKQDCKRLFKKSGSTKATE